ncbi:MAG: hypothetical protein NC924_04705 [Candidatus Omnitrophica bacterium]|nr:hypothetical protein [Candidatus Omnitrophota bacterium]
MSVRSNSETFFSWQARVSAPADTVLRHIGFGVMLNEKYDQYLDETRLVDFSQEDILSERWHDVYVNEEDPAMLTLASRRPLPAILAQLSKQGCSGHSLIQRAGRDFDAVVVQVTGTPLASPGEPVNVELTAQIALADAAAVAELIRTEQQKRVLERDDLRVLLQRKQLHIFFRNSAVTGVNGMEAGFFYRGYFFNFFSGQWRMNNSAGPGDWSLTAVFPALAMELSLSFTVIGAAVQWSLAHTPESANRAEAFWVRMRVPLGYGTVIDGDDQVVLPAAAELEEEIPLQSAGAGFIALYPDNADASGAPGLLCATQQRIELRLFNGAAGSPCRVISWKADAHAPLSGDISMYRSRDDFDRVARERMRHWRNQSLAAVGALRLESSVRQMRCFFREIEVTAEQGICTAYFLDRRWHDDFHDRAVRKIDDRTLQIESRRSIGIRREQWEFALSDAAFVWSIRLRMPPDAATLRYRAGVHVRSLYTRWVNGYERGAFHLTQEQVSLADEESRMIGVYAPDGVSPAFLLEAPDDIATSTPVVIDDGKTRYIGFEYELCAAADTEIVLSFRLSLFSNGDLLRRVDASRRERFALVDNGRLRVDYFDRKFIIVWQGVDITAGHGLGLTGGGDATDEQIAAPEVTVVEKSERQARLIVRGGVDAAPAEWLLSLDDTVLCWHVRAAGESVGCYILCAGRYEQWINGFDQGEFVDGDAALPQNRLFCPLLGIVSGEERYPSLVCVCDAAGSSPDDIRQTISGSGRLGFAVTQRASSTGTAVCLRLFFFDQRQVLRQQVAHVREGYTTLLEQNGLRLHYLNEEIGVSYAGILLGRLGSWLSGPQQPGQQRAVIVEQPAAGRDLRVRIECAGGCRDVQEHWSLRVADRYVQWDIFLTPAAASTAVFSAGLRLVPEYADWVAGTERGSFYPQPQPVRNYPHIDLLGAAAASPFPAIVLPPPAAAAGGFIAGVPDEARIGWEFAGQDAADAHHFTMSLRLYDRAHWDAAVGEYLEEKMILLRNEWWELRLNNGQNLQLQFQGRLVTAGNALETEFYFAEQWRSSRRVLEVREKSPDKVSVSVNYEFAGLREQWDFYLQGCCFFWQAGVVSEVSSAAPYRRRITINALYGKWLAGSAQGEFFSPFDAVYGRDASLLGVYGSASAMPAVLMRPIITGCCGQGGVESHNGERFLFFEPNNCLHGWGVCLEAVPDTELLGRAAAQRERERLLAGCEGVELRYEEGRVHIYYGGQRLSGGTGLGSEINWGGHWLAGQKRVRVVERGGSRCVVEIERSDVEIVERWVFSVAGDHIGWQAYIDGGELPAGMLYQDIVWLRPEYGGWVAGDTEGVFSREDGIYAEAGNQLGVYEAGCMYPAVIFSAEGAGLAGKLHSYGGNRGILFERRPEAVGEVFSGTIAFMPWAALQAQREQQKTLEANAARAQMARRSVCFGSGFLLLAADEALRVRAADEAAGSFICMLPPFYYNGSVGMLPFQQQGPFVQSCLRDVHSPEASLSVHYQFNDPAIQQIWKVRVVENKARISVSFECARDILLQEVSFSCFFPAEHVKAIVTARQQFPVSAALPSESGGGTLFDNQSPFLCCEGVVSGQPYALIFVPVVDFEDWRWYFFPEQTEKGMMYQCGLKRLLPLSGQLFSQGVHENMLSFDIAAFADRSAGAAFSASVQGNARRESIAQGPLSLIREQGVIKLFWEQQELTAALGMHAAFSYGEERFNSLWARTETYWDSRTFYAVFSWNKLFLLQRLSLTIISETYISGRLITEIFHPGISRVTFAVMLSPAYNRWQADGRLSREFPREFYRDTWIQFASQTEPVQVLSDNPGLPAVTFSSQCHGNRYSNLIEQSDVLHQCRVMASQIQDAHSGVSSCQELIIDFSLRLSAPR